jgi:hypothetical protein
VNIRQSRGMSLIELLVSMTLTLTMIPPLAGFFFSWQQSDATSSDFSDTLHDTESSMNFVIKELRNLSHLLSISLTQIYFISATDSPVLTGTSSDVNNITGLIDSNKVWEIDQWKDYALVIHQGLGEGQSRAISSNTDNQLVIVPNWAIAPDSSSEYKIFPRRGFTHNTFISYLKSGQDNRIFSDNINELTFTVDQAIPDTQRIDIILGSSSETHSQQFKSIISLRN